MFRLFVQSVSISQRHAGVPAARRKPYRPRVEALEDRCVPALLVVNTLADTVSDNPNVTSLRKAILAANDLPGDDVIAFVPGFGGTIRLTGPLPWLESHIEIRGPGADQLTVLRDSGGDYGIFEVKPRGTVTLSGLTIQNGKSGFWGGISDEGTLLLSHCTLFFNTAVRFGGGVYNEGTMTATDSTFLANSANEE